MRQMLSIIIAGLLSVSMAATAKPVTQARGKQHSPMQLFEQLTLTDAQRQSLQAVFAANRGKHQRLRDGLLRNKRALHSLRANSQNYQQRLNQLAEQRASLARKKVLLNGQIRQKIAEILTPKQLTKLSSLRAKQARSHNRLR